MLRNLNVSNAGRRDSSDGRVGVLAGEIPAGGDFPAFLLNDIDAGATGRFYSLEILTLPSAGVLTLDKRSVGSFTGAPSGTYTGTQRVEKFDPGVGRVSTADGTYSLTVAAPAADTIAPIMSGVITVSSITTTGFTLTWQAASDAVGVTGYEYSIDGGTSWTANGTGLSVAVSSLSANTSYPVRVLAFDAAGNKASPLTATATTAAVPNAPAPSFTASRKGRGRSRARR